MLLITSIVYMALAIVEGPGQPVFYCPAGVQIAIELLCLSFFVVELVFKYLFLGRNGFLRYTRYVLLAAAVVALFVEMIVYYAMGTMHCRYLRVLRPLFLLNNYYTKAVRHF